MLFEDRKRLIDQLNALEQDFAVHTWKVMDIHLWPVLKKELFFHEFNRQQAPAAARAAARPGRLKAALQKSGRLLAALTYRLQLRLQPARYVFAGAPAHRVTWKGKAFNRYFGPLMSYLQAKNTKAYLSEYYPIDAATVAEGKRFIDAARLLPAFSRKGPFRGDWQHLQAEPGFPSFLQALQQYFPVYSQQLERRLESTFQAIYRWSRLYRWLFRQVKPSFAIGLCYYSNAMYGMNVAAQQLGIKSVDMQHGAQGLLHPAYAFKKIPATGYNTLPQEFWCWDDLSFLDIRSWSIGTPHQARLVGNPWFTFLKESEKDFEKEIPGDKKLILFSHQPLVPVLDDYLIDCIKASKDRYHWWIRLHPRISAADKAQMMQLLRDHGLEQDVEVEKATRLPLPVILHHSAVHLSKYSGAIIESAMLGVPTVVLEALGNNVYAQLIRDGKVIGIPEPEGEALCARLHDIVRSPRNEQSTVNFKSVIDVDH